MAHMFANRQSPRTWSATLLAIGVLLVGSGCTGSESSERAEALDSLRQERHDLVQRFQNIQSTIRRTQAAALDDPGVSAVQDSFYAELRRYMERENPEAVVLLDRAEEIGAEVERMSGPVPMLGGEPVTAEQQQSVVGELQQTERDLRPHVRNAMADSAVRAKFAVLQASLVEQMKILDPSSPATIGRMTETAEEVRQVDIRIAELEGGP